MKLLFIIFIILYYFYYNKKLVEGLIVNDKKIELNTDDSIYEICPDKNQNNIMLNNYHKKENKITPKPKGFYSYMLDTSGRKIDNYFDPPICEDKKEFKTQDYFINNKLVDCLPLPHGNCDALNNNHHKKNNYKNNMLPLEDPFYSHANVGESYRIIFDEGINEKIKEVHFKNELENKEIIDIIENIKKNEMLF
tara:strand:- start:381 stop:962 length:582 start_codon:yes stop_codon:yes gene_type:complete